MQANYDFRKELLQVHRKDLLDSSYIPDSGMCRVSGQYTIVFSPDSCDLLRTAALDLQDYLQTSMRCSLAVKQAEDLSKLPDKYILIATAAQLDSVWAHPDIPGSYTLQVADGKIVVCGLDARGCAQGVYKLEDRMNEVRAPYLISGEFHFAPAFSPRMVHSGYGEEQYPDAHLSAIAHAGMDAILVFVKGPDLTRTGYLDFNELCYRAAKYGLDVYAYSDMKSLKHPDDPDALAHYDSTYGELFRRCPGFKGVVLVGESVEFPSKDPHVSPLYHSENAVDGLPTGKPSPGWFPCYDYHKWLSLLQQVIKKEKPDADIVFWTYNWGKCDEAARLALIDSLPTDITLMATFEMFNTKQLEDVKVYAADYTLSFPEAGPYFISEAKRAKKRGIRLYSQANSGGLTWDFGVIPYEPFPYMWGRRYRSMLQAKQDFDLCGIMESHHFGFWPSFVSKIEKRMFTEQVTAQQAISAVAEELYGRVNRDEALQAWSVLSKAMEYYVCSNENQYGPFRVGPAYPFVFLEKVDVQSAPYAMFGGRICRTDYAAHSTAAHRMEYANVQIGPKQLRLNGEIISLKKMYALLLQAQEALQALTPKLCGVRREDNLRLTNLVCFIIHCVATAINVERWLKCIWQLNAQTEPARLESCLLELLQIAQEEKKNAEEAIAVVEADSRLGWEPSMEYVGDAWHIRWKLRHLKLVMEQEIPQYLLVVRNQMQKGDK